jgi:hypothetical protein
MKLRCGSGTSETYECRVTPSEGNDARLKKLDDEFDR